MTHEDKELLERLRQMGTEAEGEPRDYLAECDYADEAAYAYAVYAADAADAAADDAAYAGGAYADARLKANRRMCNLIRKRVAEAPE